MFVFGNLALCYFQTGPDNEANYYTFSLLILINLTQFFFFLLIPLNVQIINENVKNES